MSKKQNGELDLAAVAAALASLTAPKEKAMVGVRNICGSTVSLPPFAGEPDIALHPYDPADPNSVAIISVARWLQVRKSGLYGQGLVERFDEVLDGSTPRAPEDRPETGHPDHEKNRLPDPVAFIEQTDEGEMRARIMEITSENQLHHILGTVDAKMKALEAQFRAEGDPTASRRAVRELPMKYQAADQIAQQRLEQIARTNVTELKSPRKD
jgi:hypothetical protein